MDERVFNQFIKDERIMNPTIKDVAKAANMSISTVSRVMNNPDIITLDGRNKVLKAFVDLGFQPNALARGDKYRITIFLFMVLP